MNPRIGVVASYEDHQGLISFIDQSFRANPELYAWLCIPDDKRVVVLKPNWIQVSHEHKPDVRDPIATHPAVLLAMVEYLGDTMGGRGTVCICDAPNTYAEFEELTTNWGLGTKLDDLRKKYTSMTIEILDLRREVWKRKEEVITERLPNKPDPRGYVSLNLGKDSQFFHCSSEGRYYGADYDREEVNRHHHDETHEYLLAGTAIKCDLFVNLPKLKTHKKVGLTCSLKNLVGINGDKNWLPHFTEGSPKVGGDEYRDEIFATRFERVVKKMGQKIALRFPKFGTFLYRKMRNAGKKVLGDSDCSIRNGNWRGNDTCWRMVLDLNRALLYGNPDGTWREGTNAKRYMTIIDGVVGGEGNGPLCPEPVPSHVMIAGDNPAVVDAVAAKLMNFKPTDIPLIVHALEPHRWAVARGNLDEVSVEDARVGKIIPLNDVAPAVPGGFKPHFGWPHLNPEKKA